MSVPNPVTSRRTTIAAGFAGLLVVAGCDSVDRDPGDGDEPAGAPTQAQVDADSALVDGVRAHLLEASLLVAGLRADSPTLRAALRGFTRLHDRHAEELGGFPDGELATDTGRGGDAVRRLRAVEERLQRRLVAAAVGAESGALATLLASMAAAVAQRVAELGARP